MANIFLTLPMPVGDGPGPIVDVSAMGKEKSIVVGGVFTGASVSVEVSEDDNNFSVVQTFTAAGKATIAVAAKAMRVRVLGRSAEPFSATLNVGANDDGGLFVDLPIPAGDGAGTPVDVSALGSFTTFVVAGDFQGASVAIEVSEDGVDYAVCENFAGAGGVQSKVVIANWMRTFVRGRAGNTYPFTPVVSVGAIVDSGGGGGGGAGEIPVILFQPSEAAGGLNVVRTWADVLTRIDAIRTAAGGYIPIELQFDDTFGSISFSGGAHDMENVIWTGKVDRSTATFFVISVPEGVSFLRLRRFGITGGSNSAIRLRSTATVNSPINDIVNGDVFQVRGWQFEASGGVPLVNASGLGSGDFWSMFFEEGGTGFGGSGPAIGNPVAGTFVAYQLGPGAGFQANTISSIAGSSVFYQIAEGSSFMFNTQAANLGTATFQMGTRLRTSVNPIPPLAASTAALSAGSIAASENRYNATAGALAQTLGRANAGGFPGQIIMFKEVSGLNPVTLTPFAGDTLDSGRVTSVVVPPGGSVMLITDGLLNWDILSILDPICMRVVGPFTFPAGGTVKINDLAKVDVSGGIVPVTLPAVSAANSGCKIVLKKTAGGATAMSVSASPGQTIDGAGGAAVFPGALISVTLASDGVSNWMVI